MPSDPTNRPSTAISRTLQTLIAVVNETYQSWRADRTIRLGAGLAYYALFGVIPFLALAVSIASVVFAQDEVKAAVSENLTRVLGQAEAELVAEAVSEQMAATDTGASLGAIGVITLVIASSLLFLALQDALAVIFGVPVESGIRWTIRRRLLIFLMVVGTASVLLASLILNTVIAAIIELLGLDEFEIVGSTLAAVGRVGSLALIIGMLTVLYRTLPRIEVAWPAAAVGAVSATAAGWGATWALGLYLGRVATTSLEGAAGGLVLVLTGIYVISQIVLAGAQLTKTLNARAAMTD